MKKIVSALFCAAALSCSALEEGFVSIFNGKDLTGWTGSTNGYAVAEDGTLYCIAKSGGNLMTEKEYSDFVLRFEFKMPVNANNGLGIRAKLKGNPAYDGMELQILDNDGPAYKTLHPWQYHGSIYGVVPARKGFLKPAGQWNFEEVRAVGSRITVLLNGAIIVDADIKDIKETMDGKKHPGLHNSKGHIGWLGHGAKVEWRNIRIKEVDKNWTPTRPGDNVAPEGFTALFNGKDLTGWKGVTREEKFDNPFVRQAATPEKRAAIQKKADALIPGHWSVSEGVLRFEDWDRKGYSLATAKDYKDFEMLCDWRLVSVRGDSGLYLRGCPQVQIWDAHNQWHIGSGGLYNNKIGAHDALLIADELVGDWNKFRVRMVGDKVTVWLNGKLVVDNVALENYWKRGTPIPSVEQIELQCHGDPLEFKNIYIKEL